MVNLTKQELLNISGGANILKTFKLIYEWYKKIKIKILIKRVFVD